ncbi:hypothetical protein GWO43_22085 [candidate division KSB1 bacterium]|nr:hypothetical protein [candidate division KSB1 bacterium]NIR72554.1 hypothetical protein [candidate division KSB1 bacterium]NIS27306.1 hypothetical protein [candidate division KSB1 bacterium]NIT73516.1 hypothetical protein [candidate division KSB1 bacterium]NIU28036.1 hypothetical protein [candidate division KSB1 bacterium]
MAYYRFLRYSVVFRKSSFVIKRLVLLLPTLFLFSCQFHRGWRDWYADLPSTEAPFKLQVNQKVEHNTEYPLFELRIVLDDPLGCEYIRVESFEGKAKFILSNDEVIEVPLTIKEHNYALPPEFNIPEPNDTEPYFFGVDNGRRHDAKDAIFAYCAAKLSYPKKPEIIQKPIKEIYYNISLSLIPPGHDTIEFVSEGKMQKGEWKGNYEK